MPNLTSVHLTSGAPDIGTGTVSTIDNMLGTAGTPSANVLSVQGVTSMTALKVDASGVAVPITDNSGSLTVDGTVTATQSTIGNLKATVTAVDSGGTDITDTTNHALKVNVVAGTGLNANGQATMANSAPVVLASDMPAIKGYYVAVAASQTDSVIQQTTGATGDYLDYVVVIPATTAPGVVTIKDNATALISYVGGGTTALTSVIPFVIPVGAFSRSGAWKITTGANVSVLAVGKFS